MIKLFSGVALNATSRLREGPWSLDLDGFVGYLSARGYARSTVDCYSRAAAHFGQWWLRRRSQRSTMEVAIEGFLESHGDRCRCRSFSRVADKDLRAGIRRFRDCLRSSGARIALPEPAVVGPTQSLLIAFDAHLLNRCGLADATRSYRLRYAREFLEGAFGGDQPDFDRLLPRDLIAYVSSRSAGLRPVSVQVMASSLRSFLRFLHLEGLIHEDLAAAVPTIRTWRLSTLPKALTDEQIDRFWLAFDRRTPLGARGYAIAVCLGILGLRAREVAGLLLDHVNWRRRTLEIPAGKTRRAGILPLTDVVFRALADYVLKARPRSPDRHLFLRHRAPVGRGVSFETVRGVVRRAFSRFSDLAHHSGGRVLRHTAATRMVLAGASLKEVADVLRHASIDTTAIYAKIDTRQLADVALPWPGERP